MQTTLQKQNTFFRGLIAGTFFLLQYAVSLDAQTLGIYPTATVVAGRNTTVTPSVAPTGTVRATAATSTNFTGVLSVNPTTGVVRVTDAKQAGTYTVTVTAFSSGTTTATATFTLTVTNPVSCQPGFGGTNNLAITGASPHSIAIGDFNGDGRQDFAIPTTSNAVLIRLGDGLGGFSGTTSVSVGSNPYSIAVGDFNGDGRQDFATANYSSNTISVCLGDGAGGFGAATSLSMGTNPSSIAIGDFNGDGKQDVATSNYGAGTVSIRLGNGTGGFANATTVTVGNNPSCLAIGDFNNDGKQDLATTNVHFSGTVSICLGNGTGGFATATTVSVGTDPRSIVISDFNGDGKQDFATANNTSTGTVSIRLGDGSGGFNAMANVSVGSAPYSVSAGDFNSDGKQDIAVANEGSATVSICLGDGTGNFGTLTNVPVGSNPRAVAVGDFNSDGKQDIGVANLYSGSVSIFLSDVSEVQVQGNGMDISDGDNTPSTADDTDFGVVETIGVVRSFTILNAGPAPLTIYGIVSSSLHFVVSGAPTSVAVGGSATFTVTFAPLAAGTQTSTITINNGDCDEAAYDFVVTGTTGSAPTLGGYPDATVIAGQSITVTPNAAPAGASGVTAAAGTNFMGVLSVDPTTGTVRITDAKQAGTYTVTVTAYNTSAATATFTLTVTDPLSCQATFANTWNLAVDAQPRSVGIGDFNGDGKQDIAVANLGANTVSIRFGVGVGDFSSPTHIPVGTAPYSIAVGDFNGDGKQDFATANYSSNTISIRLGNGLGGFSGTTEIPVGNNPRSVVIGDFTGDGKLDFVTANYLSHTITICMGNGAGGVGAVTHLAAGTNSSAIYAAVGDFNGDGNPDIATAMYALNKILIHLGDGLGGFTPATEVTVGLQPYWVTVGDFNGDGKQDFAATNWHSASVSIRLGDGTGNFTNAPDVPVGTNPSSIAVGDFNGDGKHDFAVANFGSATVSLRLGDGLGGFSGTTNLSVATNPHSVTVGDFNNDGKHDFVTANEGSVSVSIRMSDINEIQVRGNNINIDDGDNTPSAADYTDFGTVNSPAGLARIFNIQNTGGAPLTISSIVSSSARYLVSGAPSSVAGNSSANFTVTFVPTAGSPDATITINNDDCNEAVYDFAVTGMVPSLPVVGVYPAATVITGQSITVTPDLAPTGATGITAAASPNFSGVLSVDPATGVVRVVNAKQAGIYTVTLSVYNNGGSTTATFPLTVTDPATTCQAVFGGTTNLTVGTTPRAVVVGDFNGDGIQDLATANNGSSNLSVCLGNGTGGFSGPTNVATGANPFSIALGDFNGDGKQDLVTANNNSSGTVSICLGNGSGGFGTATSAAVGNNPRSVAIGDFNGDGRQDLVTANFSASTISICLGNGAGGFYAATHMATGTGSAPSFVTTADFNTDGLPDIAMADYNLGKVIIYQGNGLGGFTFATEMVVGSQPYSVAVGDFNGDGKPDIAAANQGSHTVSICLGNGLGGFGTATSVAVGNNPYSIAIGDFNGDGKPDLATANFGSGTVSIRLGDGLGGFSGFTNTPVGSQPHSVAIGDFNGDSRHDFVAANSSANTVSVRLGDLNEINLQGNSMDISDGDPTPSTVDNTDFGTTNLGVGLARTFTIRNTGAASLTISGIVSNHARFTVSSVPVSVAGNSSANFTVTFTPTVPGVQNATITINNDDCDEATYDFVVTAGTSPVPVPGVYPATTVIAGQNTTVTPATALTGASRATAAVTDPIFTGVLSVDPATGVVRVTAAKPAGVYTVILNAYNGGGTATATFTLSVTNPVNCQAIFGNTANFATGSAPRAIAVGDFNGDGIQDLATANNSASTVSIRLGDGLGGFSGTTNVSVATSPTSLAIGDFNGDGKPDFAASTYNGTTVSVRLGNGLGGFSGSTEVTMGSSPRSVAIGDFNGDGKQDLVTANYLDHTISISLGNGTGGFGTAIPFSTGANSNPGAVAVGDFNGDGFHDIAAANSGSASVSIRLGDGTGGFSAAANVALTSNPYAIAIGDFNRDGKQDFVTASYSDYTASIRLGDGAGNFSSAPDVSVGGSPASVAIGDFNGDGKQDLATANYAGSSVSICLGDGLGGFGGNLEPFLGYSNSPHSVVVGDFNNDGRQDFATANLNSSSFSIRLAEVNEIQVQGNGMDIPDGHSSPSTADHTDFGTINSTAGVARTFTIRNTGSATLTISSIVSSSAHYVVSGAPTSVAGLGSATFTVTFTPTTPGVENATITINNSDCDEGVYDFAVTSTVPPPPTWAGAYPAATVVAGQNTTVTPDLAPTDATGATAAAGTNFTGVLSVDPATGVVRVSNAKQAGTYTVTVTAYNAGGSITATFTLTVTNPASCQAVFSGTTNLTAGSTPRSVAVGDFNGDGMQDLATANNGSGNVSIYLGNGTGGFGAATNVSVGTTNPYSVAIGDLNGDGKSDFVTANNNGSGTVSICLGNGLGGFGAATQVAVGSNPQSVAIGDFNSDGKPDLVTANYSAHSISVCLGNGAGGFGTATTQSTGASSNPTSVAVGDFNGDGKPDIAAALYSLNKVLIYTGTGSGSFNAPTEIGVGTQPYSVAVSDFNGDGSQDIATANYGSHTVSIRLGNGMGGFSGTTNASVSNNPNAVAIGDFNGDGNPDFAASSYASNAVSIRTGNGLGDFSGTTSVSVGTQPWSVAVGDFNSDGKQDLAAANSGSSNVSIRLGDVNEMQVQGNSMEISDGDNTPSTADYTDFGTTDVGIGVARVFTIRNTGTGPLTISGISSSNARFVVSSIPLSVAANSSGTFTVTFTPLVVGVQNATITINNDDCDEAVYDFAVTASTPPLPVLGVYPATTVIAGQNATVVPDATLTGANRAIAVTAAHFTGVLSVNSTTGVVQVTDAKQAGTYTVTVSAESGGGSVTATFTLTVTNPVNCAALFSGTTSVTAGQYTYSIAIGDFNGDGKQDLAAPNFSGGVSIRLGDGLGGFSGSTNVVAATNPSSVAVGDFNRDGKQDIAITNNGSSSVSIRLGDGLGGFGGSTEVTVGASPRSVAIGDFNGDGKQDLAVGNSGPGTVSIRLGDGLGGFSGSTSVAVGSQPYSVALGDFNGDGKQDLATANYNATSVSIRLGNGLGGFSGSTSVTVGSQPYSVAIGDFNGDGKQDFATANFNATSVSIRLGDGLGGFSGTTEVSVGSSPAAVVIGDFNGDGKQDVATANFITTGTVSIRLGNGLGGFTGTTNVSVGNNPYAIAIGDFNGDGKQDFATANNNASGTVSVRLGDFSEIQVQGNSTNIDDGDNTPSMADHTDFGTTDLSVGVARIFTIRNTGAVPLTVSGIVSNNTRFVVSNVPTSVAANSTATFTVTFTPIVGGVQNATITVNSDDCDEAAYDFAVTGTTTAVPVLGTYPATSVIAGQNAIVTPDAAPTGALRFAATTNTFFTGLLDVNPATGAVRVTDAKPAGIYTVTVTAYNGGGASTTTFTLTVTDPIICQALVSGPTNISSVGTNSRFVAIGDFNGDGKQDFAAANATSPGTVAIRLGDGTGGFSGSTNITVGNNPYAVAIGDFNSDGKQDFATANNNNPGTVSIRLGDGLGGFSGTTEISVGNNPRSVAIGDFNGDGKPDFAAACSNSGTNAVSIRLGNGTGGFTGTTNISVGLVPVSVAIGDFNGDGKQDFATANLVGNTVSIRLGDGLGGFSGTTTLPTGAGPSWVAVGDFNADGKPDLATANSTTSIVSIYMGDGTGGFTSKPDVSVDPNPYSIAIGDFNGDGKQDIAVGGNSGTGIRLGDGTGGFSSTTNTYLSSAYSVTIGDFNTDGKQDFAIATGSSSGASIYLGGVNEIQLRGNNTEITDGDNTPSTTDHTDFGTTNIGAGLARIFSIRNTGTALLTIGSVGSSSARFVVSGVPAWVTAGNTATFTVTFTPTAMGPESATITVNSNDCDEAVYDFSIQGTGTCVAPGFTACPANLSVNVVAGTCAAPVSYTAAATGIPTPTLTYAFGNATVASGNGSGSGSSFQKGVTDVVITATSLCAPPATCSFTVTVTDNQAPVITCPSMIVVNAATGQCSAPVNYSAPTGTDNCPGASTTQITGLASGVSYPVGTTTNTFQVTDQQGNSTTCAFAVKVEDHEKPVANCQNVTIQLDGVGMASTTAAAVDNGSSDACGILNLALNQTSFTCIHAGNNSVVLTVTDQNNNSSTCAATVIVEDKVAPMAICRNVTVQLNASGAGSTTAAAVNNGSSDACGVADLSLDQTTFTCAQVGTTSVVLTVTDQNNNSSTCAATVTVEDKVAPMAICRNVMVQLDAAGTASTTAAAVNNGSSDACGIVNIGLSQTLFTCADAGSHSVTLTVTDVNGNTSECDATITVEDPIAPVAACQDLTVQLDAAGNGSTTAAAINNGSSDACGIASLGLSQTTFNCADTGNNSVTLTVTDVNGNASECQATITVEDPIVPVAACQDITIQLDNTGNGSTTAAAVNKSSSDACGITSLTLSQTAFTCAQVGAQSVVLTVTDANGNTSTCSATVTVEDQVAPAAICQNVIIQLDPAGNGSTTAAAVNNGSSDACGMISLGLSQTTFHCDQVGANAVVLTVTDLHNNVSTCAAMVTVEDHVPPVATCQDVTVQLDATGTGSTTAAAVNNGSSDICGIASLSLNQTAFNCTQIGANSVILTVTDANGNSAACAATVIVQDKIAPVALCQNTTVQLDAAGNGITTAIVVNNGSSDACGIVGLNLSQTTFTCAQAGANTVVLTVMDANGNTSTCSSTVMVEDHIVPAAVCQNATIQLDAAGTGSTTAAVVNNGSSDACGIASLSLSQTVFNCAQVGANTVVLTATDIHGNTSTCAATVTVVSREINVTGNNVTISDGDTSPSPADHTDLGGTNLNVPISRTFTIQNTGGQPLVISSITSGNNTDFTLGALSPAGPIQPGTSATFSVTFLAGSVGTKTSVITIHNNDCDESVYDFVVQGTVNCTYPAFSACPSNQVVANTSGQCWAAVNYTATATGTPAPTLTYVFVGYTNSSGNGTGSGLNFNVGLTTVTLTATNACGNVTCSFTVTVNDGQNPSIVCPMNMVKSNDVNQCSATVMYSPPVASDNCSGVSMVRTSGPASGSVFPKGTTMVNWKATDAAGNSSVCGFTVTVNDTQLPTITCPVSLVKPTDSGNCTAQVNYTVPVAIDNCTPAPTIEVTSGLASGANFPKGVTMVVWKATDGAGLTKTCSFNVTVNDTQAPTITCPANQAQVTDPNLCTAVVNYASPTATDNCSPAGTVTLQSGLASGSAFTKGMTTVVWRATDGSGTTSTCSFKVTVNDGQAPTIACPANQVKNTDSGQCTATASYAMATFTDNCSGGSVAKFSGPISGSAFPKGTTNVVFRATDAAGNQSFCTMTVTVTDAQLPAITCPSNLVATGTISSGVCSAMVSYAAPTATDNCGILSSFQQSGLASGSLFPEGVTTNVWKATDNSALTATCAFTVTVGCGTASESSKFDLVSGERSSKLEQPSEVELGLKIAPNPAVASVTVTMEGVGEHGGELLVYDAVGRLVLRQNVTAGQQTTELNVDSAEFATGMYQISLRTENGKVTKPLVVSKL